VPGWVNYYNGKVNYLVATVKNDDNFPMELFKDFTFCGREPLINQTTRQCSGPDYGICPGVNDLTLIPN